MSMSKRMKELGEPNPVKGSKWLTEQQKKLSKAAVNQPRATRNSEGYFTTVVAHNADPYIDPAKIQRMFSRQSSGPSFKAPRSKKLPGQGFDEFKSLYEGQVYKDPIKVRLEMKHQQRDRCLKLAPKGPRRAFRTQGGYKKPTQFDAPVFLHEVDATSEKSDIERVRKEKEEARLANLRKPPEPPNMRVPSIPKGGYGVSGQLIGGKNPVYTPDPYELKEKAERDHAAQMAEKQRQVHGNTSWVSVPLRNPNSSLVTVGVFGRDSETFGLDEGFRRRLDALAAARAKPKVMTLANWLTRYRLIKFKEELANECGIKKSADVRNLSEHELEEKGRQAGMRGAERRRFSSMQNAMVEAATGKKEELPAWVPSNPGKAGGNSVLDPKATFSPYPQNEEPKPLSQVIVERQERMYKVLPEFEQMRWAPAGAQPLAKSTSSLAMREFSGGFQKAALAITKAGKFGPAVVRGPPQAKIYAARAAHDNRLQARPF